MQSSFPFIAVDYWLTISNVLILDSDMNESVLRKNIENVFYEQNKYPIIFIKSQVINDYLSFIESLRVKFILISTSNHDFLFPMNFHKDRILNILSKNNYLIKWFVKNPSMVHEKIQGLPIGPKYQWSSTNFFGEDKTPVNNVLSNYCLTPESLFLKGDKPNLLYFNYGKDTTNQAYWEEHKGIRYRIYDILSSRFTFLPNSRFDEYLRILSTYKFSISPPGCGLDTHRAWESLMVGTIPIMMHTPLDGLFENLPVVFVDDWNDVTEEFLLQKYEELKTKKYNFDICYCNYWVQYIDSLSRTIV
jgi:hypothetical protein